MTRRMVATGGVMGGSFLAAIEATIIAAAMPTVVAQLGGVSHYSWVFSAYLLTSTVTVPLWGKLSDLYGRRRFYLAAVGFFLLGSALCGLAGSMPELIAFRALQGVGAGGIMPLGMIILGDLYTLRERGRIQGFLSGVWGVASILGPLVGGYITDNLSWRWVFYLNLPFGAVAAAAVGVALLEAGRRRRPTIDWLGAALLGSSVTLLLLALGQSRLDGALAAPGLAAGYGGATLLAVAFVRTEQHAIEPLVPLTLFADRVIGLTLLCGFLVGIAMFGAISFVPLFVHGALGGSATRAGSALTPLLLGWVLMSTITARILPRVGYRLLLVTGLSCVCLGFIGLGRFHLEASFWLLRAELGLMGLGMGMTMLTLVLAVQNTVAREQLGIATSLGQFTRSIGGAIGVAVMGALVAGALPLGRDASPAEMAEAIHRAFRLAAGIAALAIAAAVYVPAGRPVERPTAEPPTAEPIDESEGAVSLAPGRH